MNLTLTDSAATETLGQALARTFPGAKPGGAVVYLEGDLGAGKTTCVRALLHELGVIGTVRSPTYTLVDTYELADVTCVHVDLYRLQSLAEIDELGLRDVVGAGTLLLVEWPQRGRSALPPPDLELRLSYLGNSRAVALGAPTALGLTWQRELGRDTSLSPYVTNLT